VAFVGWVLETLAVENVSNVASTCRAADLRALHAHRLISMKGKSTVDGLVEGGPAAAGVELGFALVKRRFATRTQVHAILVELVILA